MRPDWPGALHHVMARGIDGKAIFSEVSEKADICNRLEKLVPEMGMELYAWVIMSNHLHLFLKSGAEPLHKLMQRLLTGFSVRYNRKYDRRGHVFQDRFLSILVQADNYFLKLVRYILLNPLRAGIVANFQELIEYKWCGYRSIAGVESVSWQNVETVLAKFGNTTYEKKLSNFESFMKQQISEVELERMKSGTFVIGRNGTVQTNAKKHNLNSCTVLGDKAFAVRVTQSLKQDQKNAVRDRCNQHNAIDKLFRNIERIFGVNKNVIKGNSRGMKISHSRSLAAIVLSERLGLTLRECARVLNMSYCGVKYAIKKGHESNLKQYLTKI